MKIIISAPSGFNTREILCPLSLLINDDVEISRVYVITPAAKYRNELFSDFGDKYEFIQNPQGQEAHDTLVRNLQADIIVTPTTGLDSNDVPLIRAGKKNNVATLTFIASWDNVYKMERGKKHGRDYEMPDYIAVWNAMKRDHLLRAFPEFPAEKVLITGSPRFDFFFHNDKIPNKDQLLEFIGLPIDDGKLVHCGTTELYPFEYVIKTLAEASKDGRINNKLHLYASVHPGGNLSKHETYKKYGAQVQYSFGRRAECPIPEFKYMPVLKEVYMHMALFKHADLLVNQSSTVAIESMLADVPVINVKYGQKWDWWNWHRSMVYRDFKQHYKDIISGGGTTIVNNEKELINATNQYLSDPSFKKKERLATSEKMLTYTDGKSSQRLLDYIKKIAKV